MMRRRRSTAYVAGEHVEDQVVGGAGPRRLRHDPRLHDDLPRQREDLEQPREVLEQDAEAEDVLPVRRRRLVQPRYHDPDHELHTWQQETSLSCQIQLPKLSSSVPATATTSVAAAC